MSEGLLLDPRQLDMSGASVTLAKNVGDTLHHHYPGYLWGVEVDENGGVVKVLNLTLSGKWGFIMKIQDLVLADDMRKVMRAGGEILERYRLKRRGRRDGELSDLKTDIFGNKEFDRD